ncbi:MAG TPA: peptidase M48 [Flavobacteriaceae bacterium]|nr:peptidase M48 [Flavobacteriaceae bacterium]HBS13284.1 peptidase M48 [Flavobacteriaceae bacterium]
MKKIISITIVFLFLVSCSKVPITGRKRVNFVSDAQILPTAFAQYSGFLAQNKLSDNAAKTAELKTVGSRISKAVDRFMRANNMKEEADNYRWEFNLIEDETVNAWCMPGGKVVFYTGILPIAKNVDGIAAIMGHEVAHAFAKHGQERMSQGAIAQGTSLVAMLASGAVSKNPAKQQLFLQSVGVGTQLGMLKFSRTHETEADRLGLVFMLMAGYNGEEAAQVWVRMSQRAGAAGAPPEFLSTHPSNQSRIADLKAYLPEAKVHAKKFNAQALNN